MLLFGLEWIGSISAVIGAYLLAMKNKVGFILFFVQNILWIIMGFLTGQYGIIFLMVGLGIINVIGLRKWTKEENSEK